jgi:hypothetical protein
MSSNIGPFRRLAVTVALAGFTAVGTVAIAPAASADDAAVVGSAPVTEEAPVVESVPVPAPVESAPAPAADPAPTPAPAPAPTADAPKPDKKGTVVEQPDVCTKDDIKQWEKGIGQAEKTAKVLTGIADKLRKEAKDLVKQAAKQTGFRARITAGLAAAADWAAQVLEEQAAKLVEKAGTLDCLIVAPGGGTRF